MAREDNLITHPVRTQIYISQQQSHSSYVRSRHFLTFAENVWYARTFPTECRNMIVRKSVTSLQHLPSTHCILDPDQSRIRAQFPASARRTFHQRDDFVPVWSSSSSLQLHLSINRELKQIEILIKANLKANRRRPPDVSLLPVHVTSCTRSRTWDLQKQASKQTNKTKR